MSTKVPPPYPREGGRRTGAASAATDPASLSSRPKRAPTSGDQDAGAGARPDFGADLRPKAGTRKDEPGQRVDVQRSTTLILPNSPQTHGNSRPRQLSGVGDGLTSARRLLWWATLDGRYRVEVVRLRGRGVRLRVFDVEADGIALVNEEVELVDGARHGPDVADVAAWQARVIALVDSTSTRKETF